jgi:hypothetical protein
VKAIFLSFLLMASKHKAYTYGYGESCGINACVVGASVTSSGDVLSKNIPSVAVPLPPNVPLFVSWIGLKYKDGPCVMVKVNDRTSPRLVDKRGFDLSPAALYAITGIRSKTWSGNLDICSNARMVL